MAASTPEDSITKLSVRLTIKVNNNTLSDTIGIIGLEIRHEINKISFAEITLVGDSYVGQSDIAFADDDGFSPGNPVTVTAGYGDAAEVNIFSGVIVKYGMELNASSTYNLKLICKHQAVSATFNKKEQEFKGKTDSAIISSILAIYSISGTVDSTTIQNELFLQKLASDWDIILSRAEFNGFIVSMDRDTLKIGKPLLSASPVLRIGAGQSIIRFSAELNIERQPPSVDATAWDIKTLALITSTATEPTLNTQGTTAPKDLSAKLGQTKVVINSMVPLSTDELKVWADGYLLRQRLSAFKGSVTFIGSSAVKTGDLITLEGVGSKFNGDCFVSTVIHKIESKSWNTTIKFGLDNKYISDQPDFSYPSALGQIPAIQGLQLATVKQLSQDPQSLYRVLITLPTNAEGQSGIWARYANFYATAGSGAGFLPEVGDEVVVGFIENDPRFPVILGSLYGTKNQMPNAPADENNYTKSITTKNKLTISFDDEKKIILIKTPASNTITLSDDGKSIEIEDQTKNSIKLSDAGITLTSKKDIKISATGNISIEATGKLTLDAKQDLAATSSMNISHAAQISFTGKGNATAEVSATGQTTIKGGIVMIN